MLKTLRTEVESLGWLIRTLSMAAVIGALYQELRKPPGQRTWHGRLLNMVPYDFRIPTPAKLMGAWWNPRSRKVLGDTPFGVGWSVNLPALADRLGSLRATGSAGPTGSKKRSKAAA